MPFVLVAAKVMAKITRRTSTSRPTQIRALWSSVTPDTRAMLDAARGPHRSEFRSTASVIHDPVMHAAPPLARASDGVAGRTQ